MRAERTIDEVLTDKAVTLALLSRVSAHISDGRNHTQIGDRLKLQKLTFLTEYPMFRKRIKGLNFTYFTYRWGPFTKDLYEVETDLGVIPPFLPPNRPRATAAGFFPSSLSGTS